MNGLNKVDKLELILASVSLMATISTFIINFLAKEADEIIEKVNFHNMKMEVAIDKIKDFKTKYFTSVVLLNFFLFLCVGYIIYITISNKCFCKFTITDTLFVLIGIYCLILFSNTFVKYCKIAKVFNDLKDVNNKNSSK